jgi:hypothetical protein
VASIPLLQKKFNRGEVSEALYGDTSLPWYGAAVRTCKNWLPISQGPLVKRSGTQYKGATRANARVRTKGFLFPDGRSYLLEFSDSILRFYRNGVVVGAPYELATPWTAAMLPFLKFTQVGNVVMITYGGQAGGSVAPRDLVHAVNTDSPWTLVTTQIETKYSQTAEWTTPPQIGTLSGLALYNPLITYHPGDRVFQGNYSWTSLQNSNFGNVPPAAPPGNLFWTLTIDDAHPGSGDTPTLYAQTATIQDNVTGQVFETGPSPYAYVRGPSGAGSDAPPMPDRPVTVLPGVFTPPAGFTVLFYSLYRGVFGSDVSGWLLDLAPGVAKFIDFGQAPDYTKQPPSPRPVDSNPFAPAAFTSWPGVGSHYDQRRLLARSTVLPMNVWGSMINNFYRWDRPKPGSDRDAVQFTIASEVLEEVRSIVPMRVCLLMTGMGEWVLRGSQGAGVTRTNVDMKRQSQWGSSWLDPLVIGNGILFNTSKSDMVRDLYPLYGLYTDVWDGDEVSWQARDLFEGYTVVDWVFQSTPYAVVWMARNDGLLLSLTYDHKREIVAWAQHTLGLSDAVVENVTVVQEPPLDAVYLVVRRTINGATVRYHERLTGLVPPRDTRSAVFLDSALTFDGRNVGPNTVAVSGGITWLGGEQVTVNSLPGGVFLPAHEGGVLIFDPDGLAVRINLTTYVSPTQMLGEVDTAVPVQYQNVATVNWGIASINFSAPHLSNYPLDSGDVAGARGVAALADGDVAGIASWLNGNLVLQAPAMVVQVGISYNSDVQLLDAYHPSVEIRNRFKTVIRMGFNVASSRGLWVGKDYASLYEWQQREVSDSYGRIQPGTGYFEEEVSDDWNKDGGAVVRHWEPLPATLLGVLREMELGGA